MNKEENLLIQVLDKLGDIEMQIALLKQNLDIAIANQGNLAKGIRKVIDGVNQNNSQE